MNHSYRNQLLLALAIIPGALLNAQAQDHATTAPASLPAPAEDILELSPFNVSADSFNGYYASQTLAGSRLKTNLDEVASSIQVVTKEFMDDVGATNINNLFPYTTSTESSGLNGNFSDWTAGQTATNDGSSRAMPQGSQRVRGLASADLTRGYFLTMIPSDRYNTESTEINRGANAILFGLGSPAGIVNTALSSARFKNSGEVRASFDSEGSRRAEFNFNQILLKDRIALRVAALGDNRQFRQKPAYDDDHRAYGTLTIKPWKNGSFRAAIEDGNRRANRPNIIPPSSTLSSWFANGPLLVAKMRAALTAAGSPLTVPDDLKVTYSPIAYSYRNSATFLTDATIPDAMKLGILKDQIIYHDNNAANPRMVFHPNMSRQIAVVYQPNLSYASTGLPGNANAIESNIPVINTPPLALNPDGKGTAPAYVYMASEQPWRTNPVLVPSSLTNLSVFDFTRQLISGDAAFQNDDWTQKTVTFEQTFLNGNVGFEAAYDSQEYSLESYIPFQGYTGIFVDTLEEYMGVRNPNLGRPFIMERVSKNDVHDVRDTVRLTAFARLTPAKWFNKSRLAKLAGTHTFTAFYNNYDQTQEGRAWGQYYQNPTGGFVYGTTDVQGSNRRKVNNIVYLGDSLMTAKSEADVRLKPMTDQRLWGPGRQASLYTYDTTTKAFITQQLDTGAELESFTRDTQKITTTAATWNGSMLENHLIGLFGVRSDKVLSVKRLAPTNAESLADAAAIDSQAAELNRLDSTFNTSSWSVVGKWPGKYRPLPLGTEVNLYYGESKNFSLGATGNDFYGNALPSPSGKTREYGFIVSMLDAKVSARLNWYSTSLKDKATAGVYSKLINQGILKPYGFLLEAEAYGNKAPSVDPVTGVSNPGTPNYAIAMEALKSMRALIPDQLKALANVSAVPSSGVVQRSDVPNLMDTEDVEGKGTEFELVVNPSRALRIAVNVAHQKTVSANYSPRTEALWTVFDPILGKTGSIGHLNYFSNAEQVPPTYISGPSPAQTGNGTTISQWLEVDVLSSYRNQKKQEGRASNEQRAWRLNALANYDFQSGFLKGFGVGSAVRWQDKAVIGYPTEMIGDTLVSDITKPHMAPAETNVDAWLRYSRNLSRRLRWQIEVRIQNLNTDADRLIPVRAFNSIEYQVAQYRVGAPRVWSITNSITF